MLERQLYLISPTHNFQLAEDKLFATLDLLFFKKKINFKNMALYYSQIRLDLYLIFLHNLLNPSRTLDELKSADLLLHVTDISDVDSNKIKFEVNKILEELGLKNIPQIVVKNNKCDLVSGSKLKLIEKGSKMRYFISAENENKFDKLRSCINEKLLTEYMKDGYHSRTI